MAHSPLGPLAQARGSDRDSGTCLVYQARPVACRAYGFYAERQSALEEDLRTLGAEATFSDWLASGSIG